MTQFENPQKTLAIFIAMMGFYLLMLYILGIVYVSHVSLLSDPSGIAAFALCCLLLVGTILAMATDIKYFIADIHQPGAGWRWAKADAGPEWGK